MQYSCWTVVATLVTHFHTRLASFLVANASRIVGPIRMNQKVVTKRFLLIGQVFCFFHASGLNQF